MSEVKSTTSQGSVLSGVNQKSSGPSFDMRSWQGLTAVLQAAREAHMEDTAYAAFRDMVLSYAQSGGDPALKARIDAVISTLGKNKQSEGESAEARNPVVAKTQNNPGKPVSIKVTSETEQIEKSVKEVPSNKLGGMRATPVFQNTPTPTVPPIVSAPPTMPTEPEVPEIEVRLETPPDPMSTMISDVSTEPFVSTVEVEREPVTPPTITPRAPIKTVEEYKLRIAEIKRIVHNEIGNPVTLMDAGNHVGRTYMNALLTAMKATGGSSPVGIDTAMQKLEEAFMQIQSFAKKKQEAEADRVPKEPEQIVVTEEVQSPEVVDVEPEPIIVKNEVPVPEVDQESEAESLTTPEPERKLEPELQSESEPEPLPMPEPKPELQPEPVPEPEIISEPTSKQLVPEPTSIAEEEKVSEVIPTPIIPEPVSEIIPPLPKVAEAPIPEVKHSEVDVAVSVPRHEPPINLPIHEPDVAEQEEPESVTEATPEPEEIIPEPTKPEVVPAVTPEKTETITEVFEVADTSEVAPAPLVSEPEASDEPNVPIQATSSQEQIVPNPVNSAHEIKDAVRDAEQSDLESEEVTTALNQLLHEWNIFSRSGIFGTGPAGKDHPLYQTLAHLPMLTVANGGWDDAELEHRQSIKDYISAWRHEQSISYNPTETFEHYLRRVVQRVLKRQKGR